MKRLLWFFWGTAFVFMAATCAQGQGPARAAGYAYLSPVPGAPYCSPETRFVLVRLAEVSPEDVINLADGFITVTAQQTGAHPGYTHLASDGRTIIFEIETQFTDGELVTVRLNPQVRAGAAGMAAPFSYQFTIGSGVPGGTDETKVASLPNPAATESIQAVQARAGSGSNSPPPRKTAVVLNNGVAVPSDFPQIIVNVNRQPDPGLLFLENGLGVPPYTMILDNSGAPVWYHRGRMYDFKIQRNGTITWCTGDDLGFPAFDQNFNYLQTYKTANGYNTDGHELKVLPNGSYFMIGYRNNLVDMGQYVQGGGDATVRETVLQEFTAAGELVFQWRPWDNYDIRLSGVDFPHLNSIEIDDDGHVLISARHLSEVTKINRDTGEIIWRLSGAHSSFRFINDSLNGLSFQHHITSLGHGRYLFFDNGNDHSPQVSRAVEYQLDLTNMTATLVWQFRDTPDKFTYWLGSAQRLTNSNTLINFVRADYPKVTEVDAQGEKQFELSMVPGAPAYRAFRFPWRGVVAAPYLVVEPQPDNVTLIFNKFGDTNVAYYRVYGGTSSPPTTVLATSFKPLQQFSNLQNGARYYFRVTAIDHEGRESEASNEEQLTVNIIRPGQNLVYNGDFSQKSDGWGWTVMNDATATRVATNNAMRIQVQRGGATMASVRLYQSGLAMIQGRTYALEFDAWSDTPRYIEAKLRQTLSPYTVYGPEELPYLTPVRMHFKYLFTMRQTSDFTATLAFNCGQSSGNIYLQDISLFIVPPGDFNTDGMVDLQDLRKMTAAWLKAELNPGADFNGDGQVNFLDFGIFGENWAGKENTNSNDNY